MQNAPKKEFTVGYNFTHTGHYMKPAMTKTVAEDQLRTQLARIIDDVSRSCRIWVDGQLAWVYHGGNTVNPSPKNADEVLRELGLHHLAQALRPSTPAVATSKAPSTGM